jgi:hypothetical protein
MDERFLAATRGKVCMQNEMELQIIRSITDANFVSKSLNNAANEAHDSADVSKTTSLLSKPFCQKTTLKMPSPR